MRASSRARYFTGCRSRTRRRRARSRCLAAAPRAMQLERWRGSQGARTSSRLLGELAGGCARSALALLGAARAAPFAALGALARLPRHRCLPVLGVQRPPAVRVVAPMTRSAQGRTHRRISRSSLCAYRSSSRRRAVSSSRARCRDARSMRTSSASTRLSTRLRSAASARWNRAVHALTARPASRQLRAPSRRFARARAPLRLRSHSATRARRARRRRSSSRI
jgi:hypothetical protein